MDRGNDLSPDDQRVLDALAEAAFEPGAVSGLGPEDEARAEKLKCLLALLNDYPVEDGDESLEHATLARIDRTEDDRAARLSVGGAVRGRRRIPLPDFISVAAVILIAFGALLPIVQHIRHRSVDMACADNLRYVGYAMSSYARDNAGALPMATAGINATWDTLTNSANLGPLLGGNYCDQGHLDCPGAEAHDHHDVDYSYQCQVPGKRLAWDNAPGTTLVLGDRNPLVDAFWSGESVNALTVSFNHGGRGQNVLGSDGVTRWLKEPVIGRGDNIWLPSGRSTLEAGIGPAGADDVFLVH